MYLLFSSTESRTEGALDMRCDAALANDLFCSLPVISKLKLHTFFFSFNLPNYRSDPVDAIIPLALSLSVIFFFIYFF